MDLVIGQTVSVKGYRSNCNARYRAGGTIVRIWGEGKNTRYDVLAGVDGEGMITIVGCIRSSLVI